VPRCPAFAVVLIWVASSLQAEPPRLAFQPAEKGYYRFDTGSIRGKLRLDGRSQGISSLVHAQSELEVAHGGDYPGLLSHYRVFSTDTRYGDAARDWPTEPKLRGDGTVEVRWPPAAEHPLEITAVYRLAADDAIDLATTVKPQRAMPGFEVFLASYFAADFRALVYVRPNAFTPGEPELLAADVSPLVDGSYLIFPRDRESLRLVFDRRWEQPPNPVQWSVSRLLAAPLGVRRHEKTGLMALVMSPPEDCFAVATPCNKTPPDGVAGHRSLYLSLFGRDLAAGQSATAHARLVVGRNLTDRQAIERYEAYRKGTKR